MKMYEILPGRLYQRGHIDHLPAVEVQEALRKHNIGVVVNLHNRPSGNLGRVLYIHWPIPDNKLPDEITLKALANLLASIIQWSHKAVLVHCNAGRNRSALLSALIVRAIHEISGKEAMEFVQGKRPNALANPHFVEFLERIS